MAIAQVLTPSPSMTRGTTDAGVIKPKSVSIVRSLTADERLGRAFVKGTIAGTMLVFLFCGGISLLAGIRVGAAIGIGVFTAIWGGPGIGGAMGATVYFSQHLEDF